MEKPPENTTKRPVGRPRGSKNKPDAGMRGNPVGRPRKTQPAPTARARTAQASLRTGGVQGECLGSVTRGLADHRLRGSRTLDRGTARSQPGQSGHSPLVAVCRAAEEAANLEDVAMKRAPVAGKLTPADLSQPPLHVPPPEIDALGSDNDQYMVDDLDELLGFSAEDSHPDDLASAPDDDDDDNGSHAMPESQDSGPANEHTTVHREDSPPVPRSSMPLWLLSNYRDLCESLRAEMNRNESHRPSAYDRGQFLLPPKNPLFTAAPKRTNDNGSAVMLRLHSWPRAPRRVVDIDYTLYIVGYRYYCGLSECRKTYQSWAPPIMEVLPPAVAAQFPFHLTYRCGVTDRLIALLRSCFQRGIGPTPFAEMIRTLHIRHYEQLMLQYYELVRARKDPILSGLLPKHHRFGSWDDRAGYAGYVPSGRYFAGLYNIIMEKHAQEIDQRMAMLSCRILTIDHSFKVRISVECLARCYNAQFMPALATIPHSLREYGHEDVGLVFTDNVHADKNELERVFPSLLQDVKPVPLSTSMECLEVPAEWTTTILESAYQISTRLNIILQQLDMLPADQFIDIAMDMEWSVNRTEGIQGRIALVTIAFSHCIYLIRLSKFVSSGSGYLCPPPALLVLLRSPRIRKFGVHVKHDMTRLFNDCGFSSNDVPFTGAVELGTLTQQRHLTSRANVSLSDLTSTVLHRYLPKDESIRVSTAWDDEILSDAQVRYAILDVYASWALRDALIALPAHEPVSPMTAAGTPVKLLSRDRSTTVAVGFISTGRGIEFNGVNITKTRVLVDITSILQPAYLICPELSKSHLEVPITTLATSFPFALLCHVKDLEVTSISSMQLHENIQKSPLPPHPYRSNYDPYSDPSATANSESCDSPSAFVDSPDHPDQDLDLSASTSYDAEGEQSIEECIPDPAAALLAENLTAQSIGSSESLLTLYEDTEIRSRVLGDIWHLMNQFKIPLSHGLRRPFARALRDALFVPDPVDKAAIEAVLQERNVTWDQMVLWKPEWVWKRVKRFVPCAGVLYPRVAQVFRSFGPLKDANTNQPLFNRASFRTAQNILHNVRLGYYSDPVGIKLYTFVRDDKNGLPVYRCIQGTNSIEGGIHMNIVKRFGSYNVSPRFAVGTKNRTGKPYQGSFDIWQRNQIAKLIDSTRCVFMEPNEPSAIGWLNGNDYKQSQETFGILPLPRASQVTLGMHQHSDQFVAGEKIKHADLAKQQQTQIAILPVHTPAERALFRLLMSMSNGPFSATGTNRQLNWVAMASRWAEHCDGKTIFYKLPEHIKSYYKTWKDIRNEKNSIEQHRAAYDLICKLIKPNLALVPRVPVADRMTLEQQII
ncbi:hypothetical protein F5887DRAFT_897466 [Amanita rubescens]|nr:hypothetical protein F5887DRAFT_897466 [Amanita rubescens]